MALPPSGRLPAAAWVLYDLANTVYAAVLTFLFTPYAKAVLGDLRWHGVVTFGSMLLAGLLVPVLGALADQTSRTRGYLVAATLVCIAATAGFGLSFGAAALLLCYFVANVSYNLGLLFYNSLLPSVAAPGREGRLSGIGTGLGYFGTILVLVLLLPMADRPEAAFPLAAALFLLAALPCLLLVPDRRPPRHTGLGAAARGAFGQLRGTLRDLPRHPALLWFLLGNFCLVDVLNTAIAYFAAFTLGVFEAPAAAGTLQLFGHELAGAEGKATAAHLRPVPERAGAAVRHPAGAVDRPGPAGGDAAQCAGAARRAGRRRRVRRPQRRRLPAEPVCARRVRARRYLDRGPQGRAVAGPGRPRR
jgi:MFS-type transporter involved in bile tolerance (Atg22 family)